MKISVTWSRTIQVHQYEPERVDIHAEEEVDLDTSDEVKSAMADLLKEVQTVGEAHVAARLRVLEALERATGSMPVAAGPTSPDPFVTRVMDDDVPF